MNVVLTDYFRRKMRRQYEELLRNWWQTAYDFYRKNEEWEVEYRFHESEKDLRGALQNLPANIQTAFQFYFDNVENQDFGNVRVRAVPTLPIPTIAVRTTTDGDDGWLEIYTPDGRHIATGRTYIELIGWGRTGALRAQTQTASYFPGFQARFEQTLWGK